jgi:hypothetical protein
MSKELNKRLTRLEAREAHRPVRKGWQLAIRNADGSTTPFGPIAWNRAK